MSSEGGRREQGLEVRELTVMVGTDQAGALARFYGEVLGLRRVGRFRDPVFEAGGGYVRILEHSGVSGPTLEPARVQINLFVDDVEGEFARAASAGAGVHRRPQRERWGGLVATLRDPDGNFVQLIEMLGEE